MACAQTRFACPQQRCRASSASESRSAPPVINGVSLGWPATFDLTARFWSFEPGFGPILAAKPRVAASRPPYCVLVAVQRVIRGRSPRSASPIRTDRAVFAALFTGWNTHRPVRGFLVDAHPYGLRVEANVGPLTDEYPPRQACRLTASSTSDPIQRQ